jgi:hypothetical protein
MGRIFLMIGRGRMDKESCKFEARNQEFRQSVRREPQVGLRPAPNALPLANQDFDIRISDF